jgi:hypothetical protein
MRFLERLRTIKQNIDDVEQCYERAKLTGTPSAASVLFPLLYRKAIDRNASTLMLDPKIVTMVGHYLAERFPQHREYFINKEYRENIALLKRSIDEVLGGSQ